MEAEMERLEFDTQNPASVQEDSHYATPARHLQEVIRNVNDSAVNRARAAHFNDTLHQGDEWENVPVFIFVGQTSFLIMHNICNFT